MLKRIICVTLCFVFAMSGSVNGINIDYSAIPVWSDEALTETVVQFQNKVELDLNCEAALLMDETTGTILYTKNEHEKLRPASVTKVMTLLLVMEALDNGTISLTDKVPCSENARKMGGSQIWLDETEQLTVHEMLKAIAVSSANDCSYAISEFISGSESVFVSQMNEKAKELGMNDTNFMNCHGLDEDNHITSAYDIAIMSRELSKNHPKIHEYTSIWMDSLRDGKSQLVNTNKLIRFYSGATGLKTGSTSLAMYNVTATATRNDLKLIAVVMKGENSQKRFDDAKTLLDYGFANYSNVELAKAGEIVNKVKISKAKINETELVIENSVYALVGKNDAKKIEKEVVLPEGLNAPLDYREKVGNIFFKLDGNVIGEANIITNEKIVTKNFISYVNELIIFWYNSGRI